MFKVTAMTACMVVFLSACATPHVVQTVKTTDSTLTCNQLEADMAEADRFRENAQKEKGMTGTNVAAVLFFWPGMIGTYSNANEAIAAADTRKAHLSGLYSQKKCSERSIAADGSPSTEIKADTKLENLKSMYDKGLITKEEYDSKRAQILNAM